MFRFSKVLLILLPLIFALLSLPGCSSSKKGSKTSIIKRSYHDITARNNLYFNAKDYKNALIYFQLAASELTSPDAKLQAKFYYARSLQLTQQSKRALIEYDAVMKVTPVGGKNPFEERCLLESARLFFDLGNLDKALENFETLAKTAKTKEFKEEALVRGGLLAAEAGKAANTSAA